MHARMNCIFLEYYTFCVKLYVITFSKFAIIFSYFVFFFFIARNNLQLLHLPRDVQPVVYAKHSL